MEDKLATDAPQPRSSKRFALRIAAALFFAVLTVAFCVLWVRSYWCYSVGMMPWGSANDALVDARVGIVHLSTRPPSPNNRWLWFSYDPARMKKDLTHRLPRWQWHWKSYDVLMNGRLETKISAPLWLPASICLLFATAAGRPFLTIPRRFSLRNMLIATTLVALVLGLVVWPAR